MSNLKQMGIAVMMYAQDYDEAYPFAILTRPTTGSDEPPGGVWSNGFWYWPQSIYTYHKNAGIFLCPSSPRTSAPWRGSAGHYGVNRYVMPTPSDAWDPLTLAALTSPARTYLMMDFGIYVFQKSYITGPVASQTWYYLPGYGDAAGVSSCGVSATKDAANYQGASGDCQDGRHFDGVNVAFADGHVKWLKSSTVLAEAKKYSSSHAASALDPEALY